MNTSLISAGALSWNSDEVVSLRFAHRRLAAYYEHNFGVSLPSKCYRSNYFSPYRLYSDTAVDNEDGSNLLSFQLITTNCTNACPAGDAACKECCTANLDKLVIRAGGNAVHQKHQGTQSSGSSYVGHLSASMPCSHHVPKCMACPSCIPQLLQSLQGQLGQM